MVCLQRFGGIASEVSCAFGYLGTFLPNIIGAITVVGMAPAEILTTFGLFYIAAGAFYGVPMAVQPMKAASAAVLIEQMDPAAIAGAGLVIGAFFLLVGLTGLGDRIRSEERRVGKVVSVSVDTGGRRTIKKTKTPKKQL